MKDDNLKFEMANGFSFAVNEGNGEVFIVFYKDKPKFNIETGDMSESERVVLSTISLTPELGKELGLMLNMRCSDVLAKKNLSNVNIDGSNFKINNSMQ